MGITGSCGCVCNCHEDEGLDSWPGPCAACCELGDDCSCATALALDLGKRVKGGYVVVLTREEYDRLDNEAWKYRDLAD